MVSAARVARFSARFDLIRYSAPTEWEDRECSLTVAGKVATL